MNRRTFLSTVAAAAAVAAIALPKFWPAKREGPIYVDCETQGLHGPLRGTFTCTFWRDGKVIAEWSLDNPIHSDGESLLITQ